MSWKLLRVMRHTTYESLPVLPSGALAVPMQAGANPARAKRLYISDGSRWIDMAEPPIGAPYVRMPGDPLPSTLYPGTTWSKVSGGSGSGVLQGTFPRFDGQYTGHEAATYNVVQTSQNKSHSHGGATGGMSANNPHNHYYPRCSTGSNADGFITGTNTSLISNSYGSSADISHTHSIAADGGTEARPVCVGIELYRRAA